MGSFNKLSLRQRLLSGGAWALTGRLISTPLAIVVNGLLARLLTPNELGAYFLTFSLVTVASIFAQLGLPRTIVRLVAEAYGIGKSGRARAAIRIVFRYGVVTSFVVAGAMAFGFGEWLTKNVFDSPLMTNVVRLAAIWVVTFTITRLLVETFRGFHDIRLAALLGSFERAVLPTFLFAALWILQGHSDLRQVLVFSLIPGVTVNVVGGLILFNRVKKIGGEGTIRDTDVLRIGLPLLTVALFSFVLEQSGYWILGAYRPQEEVAVFGAAFRLAKNISLSLMLVNAVIPPLIAELYAQGNKRKIERMMRITALFALVPGLAGAFILIFFGEPLMDVVYGEYYRQGAMVLIIMTLGRIVNVWTGSCQLGLMMTGHQNIVSLGTFISCLAMMVIGLFLVEDYGLIGVATAEAFSRALQNILMLYVMRWKTGIWTHAGYPGQAWQTLREYL